MPWRWKPMSRVSGVRIALVARYQLSTPRLNYQMIGAQDRSIAGTIKRVGHAISQAVL
jgi:hypothetical protein